MLSFPQMGTLEIVLRDLFRRLEVDILVPPETTNRTLELGVKYSPEFACLPLKITLGNFIEALEEGADSLVMVGGVGPCRFGYYAEMHRRILKSLGYDFKMYILEPPTADFKGFIKTLKELAPKKSVYRILKAFVDGWPKARAIDEVDKKASQVRAYELKRGETTKVREKALSLLDKAYTKEEIRKTREKALSLFDETPKREGINPLRVAIVGEFFLLLEPFVNFDIEEFLGERGVYVERAVYLTDWIGPSGKNPVAQVTDEEIKKAAFPYLSHFVGGDGLSTVGHSVIYAKEGFDGIIHLLPFTCMPDTIAKSILPEVAKDLDIPILSLVIDEQTGKAGFVTRLEAFIDLLENRRKHRKKVGAFHIIPDEQILENTECRSNCGSRRL